MSCVNSCQDLLYILQAFSCSFGQLLGGCKILQEVQVLNNFSLFRRIYEFEMADERLMNTAILRLWSAMRILLLDLLAMRVYAESSILFLFIFFCFVITAEVIRFSDSNKKYTKRRFACQNMITHLRQNTPCGSAGASLY